MKQFLAVYTGTAQGRADWDALDAAERQRREQAGMRAWGEWVERHAGAIVAGGGPLGRTLRVDREGVHAIRNAMAAYVVVQAEDQAAAAALFVGHPHFAIFPGDGVEVMEVLPVPGG